ncbi:hypothetical protein FOC4_g10014268 [Fusarium odoratissimum]|uniref:Uncharacterized protein n=1 Tax=Fusarium oxysporum f. sp. cubense (strain race 4) TaxID=2502994 RepID=N1R800_FUSC4|nr:hypothetical protein FOC4_g10014268 [Fusarium odoratissimum]
MDPIWVASAWKFPWRHRPPQRKPRLDLADTTLVSIGGPVAESICIPGLASLPQEVLQMVRRSKGYRIGQSITTFGPTLAHTFSLHKHKQIALSFLQTTDNLLRIGVGDAWQRHIEICTKLTGTFLFGPYQCYTDTDDASGNEPPVLVHNVPTKRVGGSLGIVTEHNFESESLFSFPRYHKDDKDPSGLRYINTKVPAKDITHANVYYNRRNGYCKGLLLEYASGAQRAVGQCRIGVDPFKAYGKPSWICYRDICDPETCEETGSCIVECTTGTNSHEREPRDIGDWVCMRPRGGGYLEFACEHKTASFGMYTRADEEEDDE